MSTHCVLLLGHIKPHKEVVSWTISGCVKAALKLASTDEDTFKAQKGQLQLLIA